MSSQTPKIDGDCRKDTPTATVAAGEKTHTAVDIAAYRQGMFYLNWDFHGDTITIEVSSDTDGTFTTLYDDGAATGYTFTAVGNKWNRIPEGAFAAGAIRISTGTAVSADCVITFCLKS